jgi:predicted helicase
MEAIFQKFQSEKWTDDPAIHFYETFLKEYDPKIRIRKGVFYTPVPVVSYIINSIHSILKKDFNLINGLAENNVTLLDPAAGTLTFPLTAIKKIKQELINQNKEGLFTSVVKDHILKNFFAFEILLAPYTIAHFKVCLTLRNLGYQIKDEDRFSLFLTNTLEKEAITQQDITLLPLIARESREAMKVKEEVPIQVVCANPPYSVSSENKSTFIEGLMDDYKKDVKEERNIQPLSDDYIKFIRFAQWKIEQTGEGIIGYITNNEYLSGLIHRGMRKELFEIFDKIYVLNLHGDLRKGDTSLGNKKDENVFDIKKGVTIAFFIKNSKINQKQVFYADLFGTQKEKYFYLSNNDVCTTKWETIKPKKPFYFFIPQEDNKQIEKIYDNFSSITEIFKKYGSGIKTHRDNFLVADSSDEIKKRLTDFVETKISDDDLKRQYNLRDTGTWNVNDARRKFRIVEVQEDKFRNYDYRPFCIKWTYLSDVLMDRPRGNELQDVNSQNPALVTTRQLAYLPFHHTFVTNKLADICLISLRTKESSYIFPLYLFLDEKRVSNIKESIIQQIKKSFNKDIDSIDVFNYIYAILNCRKFRTKYAAFLKINFPRIPFTSDYKIFLKLIKLGAKLKDTHLLNLYSDEEGKIGYPNDGTNIINEIRYDKKNHHLYINDTQYFDGILNEEWNFFIGGHKILYGWLKDMKNKKLSSDEIRYFIKIIASIKETIKIMRLLDTLYDKIEKNIMPIKTTTQKLFNNL